MILQNEFLDYDLQLSQTRDNNQNQTYNTQLRDDLIRRQRNQFLLESTASEKQKESAVAEHELEVTASGKVIKVDRGLDDKLNKFDNDNVLERIIQEFDFKTEFLDLGIAKSDQIR